jgi:hypothetical protein
MNSKVLKAAALTAGALLLVSGAATAAIPDAGAAIFHACVRNKDGAVRLIDPSKGEVCLTSTGNAETAVQWNQTGPQGVPGSQGAPGPQGMTGQQGPVGPAGGGGPTTAQIRSRDTFGRGTCGSTYAFISDNCGNNVGIATAFGWTIDAADYPAGATFSFQTGLYNYSSTPQTLCFRLVELPSLQPAVGSETCATVPAGTTTGPSGTAVHGAPFTLPAGARDYATQNRSVDAPTGSGAGFSGIVLDVKW